MRKASRLSGGETVDESLEELRKDRTEGAASLANEVDDEVADKETASFRL